MPSASTVIIAVAALGFIGCTVGALWASYRLADEAPREAKPALYNGPMTDGPLNFGLVVVGCVFVWLVWMIFF